MTLCIYIECRQQYSDYFGHKHFIYNLDLFYFSIQGKRIPNSPIFNPVLYHQTTNDIYFGLIVFGCIEYIEYFRK